MTPDEGNPMLRNFYFFVDVNLTPDEVNLMKVNLCPILMGSV